MIDKKGEEELRRLIKFRDNWDRLVYLFIQYHKGKNNDSKMEIYIEMYGLAEQLNYDYISVSQSIRLFGGTVSVRQPLLGIEISNHDLFTHVFYNIYNINDIESYDLIYKDLKAGHLLINNTIALIGNKLEEFKKVNFLQYYLYKFISNPCKLFFSWLWTEYKSLPIAHVTLLILVMLILFGYFTWKDIYHLLEIAAKR